MYLYFNKLGILTTSIPHGEIPRQGSTLNIYVCLDSDFFETEEKKQKSVVNIDLILPNDEIGTRKMVTVEHAQLLPFKAKTSDEALGDFIDGAAYLTYHFKFSPKESTIYAGKVVATVSIREIESGDFNEPINLESIEEIEVKYFGAVDVIIEKTLGCASFNDNISQSHYSNLLKQINALSTRLNNLIISGGVAVSANPELSGDEQSLNSIMIDGVNYKIDSINQEELDEISQTIKEEIEPQIEEIKQSYALKTDLEKAYDELIEKINNVEAGNTTDYNQLLNKPIINEETNDTLYIVDKDSNIVAQFDRNGLHTVGVTIKGEDILDRIEKIKEEIVVDYDDLEDKPIIKEENDDTLYIADNNGNVIVRIDKTGLYTTFLYENGELISTKYVSKETLEKELAELVGSTPETLDTLKELADALGNNENFSTTVMNLIGAKLGKDETAVDSEKLGGIEAGKYAFKEEIISDYNDLENKPIENEQEEKTLVVVDNDGNIIVSIDEAGIHSVNFLKGEKNKEVALQENLESLEEEMEKEFSNVRDEIITDYNELENIPVQNEENDDTLYITDKNGNIITRIDSGGLHTTNVYLQGKEVALKEMTFTGTMEEYESANANGMIPVGAIVNIIDD